MEPRTIEAKANASGVEGIDRADPMRLPWLIVGATTSYGLCVGGLLLSYTATPTAAPSLAVAAVALPPVVALAMVRPWEARYGTVPAGSERVASRGWGAFLAYGSIAALGTFIGLARLIDASGFEPPLAFMSGLLLVAGGFIAAESLEQREVVITPSTMVVTQGARLRWAARLEGIVQVREFVTSGGHMSTWGLRFELSDGSFFRLDYGSDMRRKRLGQVQRILELRKAPPDELEHLFDALAGKGDGRPVQRRG